MYFREVISLSNDSEQSEISSNLSYEYARERSRCYICADIFKRCHENIYTFQNALQKEEYILKYNENVPLAGYYIDKVLGRVDLMLQGEYLGEMVDSDIENLLVDQAFEDQI